MFRTKNILIAIIVIAVILAGGYFLTSILKETSTREAVIAPPTGGARLPEEGGLVASTELPTYTIMSTRETYTGALGLRGGASRACEEEFGQGSVMYGTQYINCYTQGNCVLLYFVRGEAGSWFDYTSNSPIYTEQSASVHVSWSDTERNCNGWTSNNSDNKGSFVTGAGRMGQQSCDVQLPIACAVPVK